MYVYKCMANHSQFSDIAIHFFFLLSLSLASPSVDDYPIHDDCLDDKREDYWLSICPSLMSSCTGKIESVGLRFASFVLCVCVFLTIVSLFVIGFVFLCIIWFFLVVSTSAIDCLERLAPEMTSCCMSSGTLLYSLFVWGLYAKMSKWHD